MQVFVTGETRARGGPAGAAVPQASEAPVLHI